MAKPPIYIIDDDPEICRALALVLAIEHFETTAFTCAQDFLSRLPDLSTGVIVSDVCMPGMDGLELIQAVTGQQRADPIILITAHADVPLAVRAIKLGAFDFIEKPFDGAALIDTIAAAGRSACEGIDTERLNGLSRRERQVFEELIRGGTNKHIGIRLGISPRTVEVHRAKLMRKMAATTLSQLVRLGIEARIAG